MTMNFRTIKDSIIDNVLGPAEAGRFQTIGFQRQTTDGEEVLGSNRFVQCYYSSGDFSKRGGRLNGPTQHDITFRIDLTVSSAAEGDLSVINNPASTPEQVSAALAAMQEATALADASLDELIDIVYQIIMDGRNIDLGLDKGTVVDRWITDASKDQPVPQGEFVVLTGAIRFTVRTAEQIPGDTGIAANIFDTVIDIEGDDVEKTGVTVVNT